MDARRRRGLRAGVSAPPKRRGGGAGARVLCVVAAAIASAIGPAGGCSDDEHPGYLKGRQLTTTGAGGDFDAGGPIGPPSADADASWICGNQVHQIIVDAPNLYFVLDASGSMAAMTGGETRYDTVRIAVVDLVRTLGPLINAGAAVFPRHATDESPCHVGEQVFPMSPGDPVTGEDGPTTTGLRKSTLASPFGGTPTAATLLAIAPTLKALPGKTVVLLATDGGPNCNEQVLCDVSDCMPNIEGECGPEMNCCAPGQLYGPTSCVDRAATVDAIDALKDAGIAVYVIGIPGSEYYADVLGDMAIAGGVAQSSAPYYYAVDELAALGGVLASIADVVVTCTFDLVDPPREPGNTNVYFDQTIVPNDPENGWQWTSDTTIEIVGQACNDLKNGQVKQVQIVSGCPTEGPK